MPRNMRRFKQALSEEECRHILERGITGILTVHGEEGYPYPVPINYVLIDDTIYMHSAVTGHKIDAITANPKAAFCVIDADEVVPETYSTDYRSVIAFGQARLVEDEAEKMSSLRALGDKYNPGDEVGLQREIDTGYAHVAMIAFEIEHMTGKEGLRLSRLRQQQ